MPQIISQPSTYQNVTTEGIPSGTSSTSILLDKTAVSMIRNLPSGCGVASDLLKRAGIRTIESFYYIIEPGSFFTQDDNHILLQEGLSGTHTQLYDLATWPENWNGYGSLAPSEEAIQYADHWVETFYQEIMDAHFNWIEPNVTASAEGEVVFEWRYNTKNLTIYVGSQSAEYVKDWGADINTEMEDGSADSPHTRRALWSWLLS